MVKLLKYSPIEHTDNTYSNTLSYKPVLSSINCLVALTTHLTSVVDHDNLVPTHADFSCVFVNCLLAVPNNKWDIRI